MLGSARRTHAFWELRATSFYTPCPRMEQIVDRMTARRADQVAMLQYLKRGEEKVTERLAPEVIIFS
jgi:hypothetical protein